LENFEELGISKEIMRGVEALGYHRPFPIQRRAIGPLMAGRNVVGQAKAGSGKTAAFGIPLLHMVNPNDRRVQALVLAPTRELAAQIAHELTRLGSFTGISVLTIYGGQSIDIQLARLRQGANVVVGTPGRLIDHLRHHTLHLDAVRFAVIDEADVMLDMGFIDDVEFILASMPEDCQLSLFSATMPGRVIGLSERFMRDPEHILIDQQEASAETLEQFYASVERSAKLDLLLQILGKREGGSAVVFCRTRRGAVKLAKELQRRFLSVTQLHGDLTQNQRDHAMNLFRAGKVDTLVTTDVAARGIDVRHIACVINYDVPEDPTVYLHRVGRTARAGDPGRAYTFVSRDEKMDFERILHLAKSPIRPMRPEDEIHVAPSGFERQGWARTRGRGRDYRHGHHGRGKGWTRRK